MYVCSHNQVIVLSGSGVEDMPINVYSNYTCRYLYAHKYPHVLTPTPTPSPPSCIQPLGPKSSLYNPPVRKYPVPSRRGFMCVE